MSSTSTLDKPAAAPRASPSADMGRKRSEGHGRGVQLNEEKREEEENGKREENGEEKGVYVHHTCPCVVNLSLLVYQVKLDWLPLHCIALIQPSQLSCLSSLVLP